MAALSYEEILATHTDTFAADASRAQEALRGTLMNTEWLPIAGPDIDILAGGGGLVSTQSQPFTSTRLFYELARDINNGREVPLAVAQAVGGLLLRLGVHHAEPAAHAVKPVAVEDPGYCHNAERHFRDAYHQLSGNQSGLLQNSITVYRTPDGKPALLQKAQDYDNALTLTPMQAGNLYLPAGTLVMLPDDTKHPPIGAAVTHHTPAGDYTLRVRELPAGPIALNIGRLTAFAFEDPRLRTSVSVSNGATNGKGWDYVDVEHSNSNATLGIQHFCQAAQDIMAQCGVIAPDNLTY